MNNPRTLNYNTAVDEEIMSLGELLMTGAHTSISTKPSAIPKLRAFISSVKSANPVWEETERLFNQVISTQLNPRRRYDSLRYIGK